MDHPDRCIVCESESATHTLTLDTTYQVECPRCGPYRIERMMTRTHTDADWSREQRANASGWLRSNASVDEDFVLKAADVSWLMALKTPGVGEKAVKLLRHLAERYPTVGKHFAVIRTEDVYGVTWTAGADELHYIWNDVLGAELKYLKPGSDGNYLNDTCISPKGFVFLESMRSGRNEDSPYGFVAMRFCTATDAVREHGLKPAIVAAGYGTTLIDEVHHLNHIDDEIIAGIRRSRFLVADLTGQRQNVYYEAGLAQGLGIPVIWTCHEDEISKQKLHLDVRQYAFIKWKKDFETFAKQLTARIIKTIGTGPYYSNE